MRAAIVSDVHGNLRAFEAVLRTCGTLRRTWWSRAAIWLTAGHIRRRSSTRFARWDGRESAEIRTRCFGRRRVCVNLQRRRRNSGHFLGAYKI